MVLLCSKWCGPTWQSGEWIQFGGTKLTLVEKKEKDHHGPPRLLLSRNV